MYVISSNSMFPSTQCGRRGTEKLGAKRVYVPDGYDPIKTPVGLWPDDARYARRFITLPEARAFRSTLGIPERYRIERV